MKKERFSYPPEPGNPLQPGELLYEDLLELYGHDEERGITEIILEKGTAIEIAIEDELGATSWKKNPAKKWGDTKIAERGRSVLVMRARYRSAGLIPHQRGWTDAG